MTEDLLYADEIVDRDEHSEYEFVTEEDGIILLLEIAGKPELLPDIGHVLVEMSDGHPYFMWYSTDPQPDDNSLYTEIPF
jgi:hypothetical protein